MIWFYCSQDLESFCTVKFRITDLQIMVSHCLPLFLKHFGSTLVEEKINAAKTDPLD